MTRELLIGELRDRLESADDPRLQILLILALCGLFGFLTSVVLLAWGVHSMAARYPLAGIVSYAAFLLLLRLWIAWKRGRLDLDVDVDVEAFSDIADLDFPRRPARTHRTTEPSGDHAWDVEAGSPSARTDHGGGAGASWFPFEVDLEDLWWLALAAAALFAGVLAVAYIVYIAPLLLAEIALDAALVSAVYRRLRRHEAGHWSGAISSVRSSPQPFSC